MERKAAKSFTRDDASDICRGASVNKPETVPLSGVTSADVMTGEVENKRSDKMCTTDDDTTTVNAEDWPATQCHVKG